MELLAVFIWRHLMFRTTVIAITGSVGKTTAKEMLYAILSARGATLKTSNNENDEFGVPRTLRRLRPWHRFAVIELGTGSPGTIRRSARLVRPDVAVVLSVARTHTNVFKSLDDTAVEKASLLASLRAGGVAVLNGDDPRVAAMKPPARVSRILFGQSDGCEPRGVNVRAQWPERLSLDVEAAGEVVPVRSRLVGDHWTPSLLGAMAAAGACGVALADAAQAIVQVAPFAARMQPVTLPNGAVVVRDDVGASPDALAAMIEVMRHARARRRILVFSDLSDSKQKPRQRLRRIGAVAAELTDLAIFVGGHAHHAVSGAIAAGMDASACHDLIDLEAAAELLRRELRDGDLVFLKGRTTDHLSRVLFAQFGAIGCWTSSCSIRRTCELCTRLRPQFDIGAALADRQPRPISLAMAAS